MKKIALMTLVGAAALSSCGLFGTKVETKTFKNMGLETYKAAAGQASFSKNDPRETVLTATGMKANTDYIAHYHAKGTADATDVCKSNGAVVGGKIGGETKFTSSADGKLTIKGTQALSDLKDAAYINIHEAADPKVVPLCAPL